MSVRVMAAVFDSKTLGPIERLVMLALADHADDSGRCYPSNARLCERTGLSERAVRQNIRSLEGAGYLTVILGAGQSGANVYIVRPDGAPDAPRQEMPPGTICRQGGHVVPERGAPDAPKPSVTIKEPSERKESARGSRLSPDWFLSRDLGEWAMSEGMTRDEIRSEADKFRDYWIGVPGAKGRKLDWPATWRNWVRKFIADRAKGNGNGNRISAASTGGKRIDPALEQIARLAGLGATPGDGRGGAGSFGEEAGPLWMGTRPQ